MAGVLGLLAFVFWAAGTNAPPPARVAGAGLPPTHGLAVPDQLDIAAAARRAEIAAEEARLAALRDARFRLEQELDALRRSAEEARQAPAEAAAGGGPVEPPRAEARGPALRVVVLHRANSPPAANAAAEVAEVLRGGGFEVQAVRGAPFVPSTPVVRYFHEQDQAAAARLAAQLGGGWAVQDFRAFQPQPAPQTLEVWLPPG